MMMVMLNIMVKDLGDQDARVKYYLKNLYTADLRGLLAGLYRDGRLEKVADFNNRVNIFLSKK